MLSLPHRRALLGRAAVFDPLSVAPYRLWLPTPGRVWADTARTTPASIGGLIATIDDQAASPGNLVQATAVRQPLWQTDGAHYWSLMDGVNDFLLAPGIDQAAVDIYLAVTTSDTQWLMVATDTNNPWVGAVDNSGGQLSFGAGTPTWRKNGAAINPVVRNDLLVAYSTGAPVVISILNASLRAADGWANLRPCAYIGDTYMMGGRFYGGFITPPLSAANRANVEHYLGQLSGAPV
jgi:hypothetical protein